LEDKQTLDNDGREETPAQVCEDERLNGLTGQESVAKQE
jgi:hypothetical protein